MLGQMTDYANSESGMGASEELLKQASIVVCTVDRRQDLETCLESLLPFSAAGAEIIVVNNGPHAAPIAEIAQRHHASVVMESRRGVSRARNTGIRAAKGRIVAFLDDDSIAGKDWLPRLLGPFNEAEVFAVVGSIGAQSLGDPVSRAFDKLHRAQFPESQITFGGNAENDFLPMRAALVGNANMAIRRDVFDRCGYFDPRFGRGTRIGSGEEPDLLLRILLAGGKVAVEPAAQIFHRHSTEWRTVRRWAFTSGCAHTAMLAKYFLQERSLRRGIFRYFSSRLHRDQNPSVPTQAESRLPRIPFLVGSLYGPLAFLLSGNEKPTPR